MGQTSFAVKRANPRFKLFGDAEATLRNGMPILGQLTELSLGGCYIHTLEPIPIGTSFQLRIGDGTRSCEVGGKAIYMHSGYGFGVFGIGVKFESVPAEEHSRLDAWLRELRPSFHPASGKCDVQECLNPAMYRAMWQRSGNSHVVCGNHKDDVEGKPFSDVSDLFDGKSRT